ncbi:MAG: hypothetical protein H3C34_13995 [Caldilineaceae bacterium]|nr:hypothetical protein [Caldilineaceae bacterium]
MVMSGLLATMLAVLLSTGILPAQTGDPPPPPFCGELAAEDCELLATSQARMRGLTSMSFAADLALEITGIPELPDEEASFAFSMDTVVHQDPVLGQELEALASTVTATGATPEEFGPLLIEFLRTFQLDLDMVLYLPPALAAEISASEDIDFPTEIRIPMRIVDGFMYVNAGAMAETIPEMRAELAREGITGWAGFDLVRALELSMDGELQGEDLQPLDTLAFRFTINNWLNDEATRAWIEQFIIVERLEDGERDGAALAGFRTTLDLPRMVMNPQFTRYLRDLVDVAIEATGEEVDSQEVGAVVLGMQMLATILMNDFQAEMVQYIGVDDAFLYDHRFDIELGLGGIITLLALTGEELPPELVGAEPHFTMNFDTHYADFDNAPAVEAPEDAYIAPLEPGDGNLDVISQRPGAPAMAAA